CQHGHPQSPSNSTARQPKAVEMLSLPLMQIGSILRLQVLVRGGTGCLRARGAIPAQREIDECICISITQNAGRCGGTSRLVVRVAVSEYAKSTERLHLTKPMRLASSRLGG